MQQIVISGSRHQPWTGIPGLVFPGPPGHGLAMRCLYEAETVIDACLVRDYLESESFAAIVVGDALSGSFGMMPGLVRVLVPEADWPAATAALADWLDTLNPPIPGRLLPWPELNPGIA
ncbi:hypothetical protein C7S18_22820 [Ahniella affigens]|uniref:DUF2007 domain-containing protein n=1 Tax=Ahniella affigens TaxID=2021234 RepID=A0A2P1PYC8_9GAMM|nr:DUF2007 domain-containing protein [Ahniella affigens]AVP99833.1 hypothetical protein C7S18_22820 [Ahniella affigens]